MGLTNKVKKTLEAKHLHKATSQDIDEIINDEHQHICGYMRNTYVNPEHNIAGGNCALRPSYTCLRGLDNTYKGCPVYKKWLRSTEYTRKE